MPKRSASSAGAVYLKRAERLITLKAMAQRAAGRMESIRRVILFGSTVSGIPAPRSDADLLVEVTESPHTHPRDRIPDVLRALSPLPCPIDLTVLSSDEIASERTAGSAFLEAVLAQGVVLFER
jgi:predicted nucleotidyltransferase